jgi:hypothetical protein
MLLQLPTLKNLSSFAEAIFSDHESPARRASAATMAINAVEGLLSPL